MNQQILFSSADQSQQTFENFFSAENQNVIDAIKLFLESEDFGCFYLYGQSGSGKTHLLSAACSKYAHSQYINLTNQPELPEPLTGLERLKCLALDNFQDLGSNQAAILLIYETLKQNSGKLLIAATLPPMALNLNLNDLQSRLLAGHVFELKLLSDDNKVEALRHRAALRGFELSDEVLNYIIHRYPRDFKTLFGLLDRLDDASLSSQRKLTIPFIKQLEVKC